MTIATIDMVAGDNLPLVTLNLTDNSSGSNIDVSQAVVIVQFRVAGGSGGVTLPCANVADGTDGRVAFNFPGTVSNVPAGLYEGQIVITYNSGSKQTVYDILKFRIRTP